MPERLPVMARIDAHPHADPAERESPACNSEAVDAELLTLMAAHLNMTLVMNAATAIGMGVVLSSSGISLMAAWVGVVLALTALRWLSTRKLGPAQMAAASPEERARWRRRMVWGLYLSAASWIVLTLLAARLDDLGHYLLAIALAALAAGGTGILSPLLWPGRLYIAAMLIPGSLLLFEPYGSGLVMSALGLTFAAVMMIVHTRNYRVVTQGIHLKLTNTSLVAELRELNHGLEARIEERTAALLVMASTDALTGLPNRRHILEFMERRLDGDGSRAPATLMFLDLDRFKQINDALGHACGDSVLCETAARLRAALPESALLARWGGDEFVAILHHGESSDAAELLGERLILSLSDPIAADGRSVTAGVSIGMARFPEDATSASALVVAADLAVAEAKQQGRGRVVRYQPRFSHVHARRFDLDRALPLAIERGELALHYQPIYACASGALHGYEALMRWNHPQLGPIDPSEFIPIAEESDTIHALGEWALRTACAKARELARPDHAPHMAVNVSVKQLADPDFALRVAQILNRTGLPPSLLELEVTESLFTTDRLESSRLTIESLRSLGIALAIDDFGTGYSSLSRLLGLPVSTVKIDRSFVAELEGSGAMVIESTILLARKMGLTVLAEGVETQRQAELLEELGVDLFQGYHFGRPSAMERPARAQHAGRDLALQAPEGLALRTLR